MSVTKKHHRTVAGEVTAADVMRRIKAAQGEATAMSLNVAPAFMTRMLKADLVVVKSQVASGKRGRPASKYGLTDKGRNLARRAI